MCEYWMIGYVTPPASVFQAVTNIHPTEWIVQPEHGNAVITFAIPITEEQFNQVKASL